MMRVAAGGRVALAVALGVAGRRVVRKRAIDMEATTAGATGEPPTRGVRGAIARLWRGALACACG